jgi:hypothetical protein
MPNPMTVELHTFSHPDVRRPLCRDDADLLLSALTRWMAGLPPRHERVLMEKESTTDPWVARQKKARRKQ